MDSDRLCCSMFKALSLDPVPVIGTMIYVPRAEGFDLMESSTVTPCPVHRFTFRHTTAKLLQCACKTTQCTCASRTHKAKCEEDSDSLSVIPTKLLQEGGVRRVKHTKKVLWAYEISSLVTVYKWLLENRSVDYTKCCDAVIVYQLKKSRCLPPGLYVYRKRPQHFGCTAERPIAVIEQFNFLGNTDHLELPDIITIDMYPGRDNFSSMYIVTRKLMVNNDHAAMVPEYSNRVFGEVSAMGIMDSHKPTSVTVCEHYQVAVRTSEVCVLDLRWKGLDTKSSCVKAIPRISGLRAVMWSNHTGDTQEVECRVLAYILGLSNELPKGVEMVDNSSEPLGVRYILVDMDGFHGILPRLKRVTESFCIHTYFSGDVKCARAAIGDLSGSRVRMGLRSADFDTWYTLPALGFCHPTPFTCGVKHSRADITQEVKDALVDWTLKTDGSECQGLAVQHTLYYHAERGQYKMMITHIIADKDNTFSMFKL